MFADGTSNGVPRGSSFFHQYFPNFSGCDLISHSMMIKKVRFGPFRLDIPKWNKCFRLLV